MSLQRKKPLAPGKPLRRTGWPKPPRSLPEGGRTQPSGVSPKPRKPLPVESERRKRERPKRAAVRAEVLARDRGCVAHRHGLTGRCAGPLDVHEIIRRSRWSAGYLEPDNCVVLCRSHHDWVTLHDTEAMAVGLSKRRPLPG